MKKWLCILIFTCCLLLCACAAAEDHLIPVSLGGTDAGTISVPENVIVLTEKGGSDGIVCSRNTNGTELSVSLQNYDFFHGGGLAGLHQANADDRVVIIELEERTLYAGFGEPITMDVPVFRTGRVRSFSGSTLVLDSFELKADPAGGEQASKEDWEEYCRYITDEDIHFSSRAAANGEHRKDISTTAKTYHFDVDLKGDLVWEFDVDVDRSPLFWNHYHIYAKVLLDVKSLVMTAESDEAEITIPLPSIPITMGLAIPISITAQAEYRGSLGVKFSKGFDLTIDFDLGLCDPEFTADSNPLGTNPEVISQDGLSVFVGLETGVMGSLFEVIEAGITFDAGFSFDNYWYHDHFFIRDKEDVDHDHYHACDQCYYLEISPAVGPLALKVVVVKFFARSLDLIERHKFPPVYQYHSSDTFTDEHGDGKCPLVATKVSVHVVNEGGIPISQVDVSYAPVDETHYQGVISAKTDKNGNANIYVPPLASDKKSKNKVTVTASMPNPLDPDDTLSTTAEVTGSDEVQAIVLKINTKASSVSFDPNGSGTVENMPDPIHFYAEKGPVNIPDNTPSRSGVLFTGWNTKADGTGDAVVPGASWQTSGDTVLYAQWTMLSHYYVIQYNANGGSYAPEGQVVPAGMSALLTDERAYWDQHRFLGWSRDDTAEVPEFPVGKANEFVNTEEKFIVTLYAVWGFYPVDPPIGISFDMNGGPESRAPSTQWITRGSWMMIPTRRVWWDEVHKLLGWSTDPNAASPAYFAGRSYHFTETTKLYAVWQKLALCALRFADPAGNDTANMPGDVLFAPEMSPWVTVPDTVPRKSGRLFTGWNTEPDGSGKAVQPGAVLLLYEDTTLYAQWELADRYWMVLFNANGGESAPSPQLAYIGKDMTLTSAPASWSGYRFLGWSRDRDAEMPEYPAGQTNIIPYSLGKNGLVLYAVWGFTPVDQPVRVAYDMNGGPESGKPAAQWHKPGSWLTLSSLTPSWDGQHLFLGWSLAAGAKEPEYRPGDTVRFEDNATLYAVWKISYRITEGDGSAWYRKKDNDQRFAADGSLSYFSHLEIDGKKVPDGYLTVTSGSTVVLIDKNYLRPLADGTHSITFVYEDGKAEGTFRIVRDVPLTGDRATPLLWICMVIVPLALMTVMAKKRKAQKK